MRARGGEGGGEGNELPRGIERKGKKGGVGKKKKRGRAGRPLHGRAPEEKGSVQRRPHLAGVGSVGRSVLVGAADRAALAEGSERGVGGTGGERI